MPFAFCSVNRVCLAAATVALVAACFVMTPAHAEVTIDMVTVGNAGNAADPLMGKGSVDREYRIGKYEVTIQQYTDFLNAVAATDTYGLYNTSMASDLNIAGISQSGTSGAYSYSVIAPSGITPAGASSPGNRPITYVSWFDAARFANWMHNGQGSGSTETGAYTLVGGQTSGTAPKQNDGAQFYIPTENEWYKAAYFSPVLNSGIGGYYTYATQSNDAPGNNIGSGLNQANYAANGYSVTQSGDRVDNQNYLTDVGAFTNSASYYGTFDQSGNVFEWNDLTGVAGSDRGLRGGGWYFYSEASLSSNSGLSSYDPSFEDSSVGFRLASPVVVPEPSTYAMALAGVACGGFSIWRRKRA